MSPQSIPIEPGYKGIVSGVASAEFLQRATISIKSPEGRIIALTTLHGTGENVPLKQEANPAEKTWSFGPFNEPVTLLVLIEASKNGDNYSPSKVIKPANAARINVADAASLATNPATYVLSTIFSEDHVDNDFTDCIINVCQWK